MENIDDMKIMWQALNDRLDHLENENRMLMHRIMKSDHNTARERLQSKYFGFIVIECIMIIFITLFLIFNPLVNEKYRIATLIYWDVFFLLEIGFDTFLLVRLKRIDIYTASLKEVAKRAAENWKLHKLGIIIGLPLAFGAIILFALALNANEFTIYGMIVGGIIGAAIGLNQLLKFKNNYKLLQVSEE